MIVSVNSGPARKEFDKLLASTMQELNDHAQKFQKK